MKLTVDHTHRYAKMRAHTATHLLHFMLHQYIDGGTKQAGSLVDNDLLRFDFSAKSPLSEEILQDISKKINEYIYASLPVVVEEMSYTDATQTGAKAFFEDKYGDTVRVVQIQNIDLHSIELCGGTHVANTKDIGAFHIISQSSVASGVRRITAYTGPRVAEAYQSLEKDIKAIGKQLDCTPKQIPEKLEKTLKEYEHIKADHESLEGQIICTHLENFNTVCALPQAGNARGDGCIINASDSDLGYHNFKDVINHAKSRRHDRNRIIYNNEGNYAIHTGTGGLSAKAFATEQGLKGGGSDQFVQGKDPTIIQLISS